MKSKARANIYAGAAKGAAMGAVTSLALSSGEAIKQEFKGGPTTNSTLNKSSKSSALSANKDANA